MSEEIGYQLSVGGEKGDSEADLYEQFDSLSVTQSTSSVDTWNAELPAGEFEDDLLAEILIYYTEGGSDETIFRGDLESYETDFTSGMTTISGQGPLARLDRDVISRTYDDTTAYDALVSLWAETNFDALVSPPNSDIFDESYLTEWEHRSLWGYFGDTGSTIETDDVYVDRNELVFEEPNILLDDENPDGEQRASINLDESTDRIWLRTETTDAVPWLRAGMRQHNGSIGSGTIEKVTETHDYETPQRVHIFDFEFSDTHDRYRPLVEIGDYTTEITRSDVIVADQSDFSELDDVELDGTKLDVLQELHDLASYEFTVRDYEDLDVRSFPTGQVAPEPDWKVTSATRKRSFNGYANRVTVQGGRDGGDPPTATSEDQDEINLMDSMGIGDDGVIEHYEKDPELTTQSSVDDRADRLLKERVGERDESGSLEIAPQFVPVGFMYNVSVWGDSFPYGDQIGANSVYLDGDSVVNWEWDGNTYENAGEEFGDYYTFEVMIHPDISDLSIDEYHSVLHARTDDTDNRRFEVRLYGDGSIGLIPGDSTYYERTESGIVDDDAAQRLSVQWHEGNQGRKVYVDGQLEFSSNEFNTPSIDTRDEFVWWIGADSDGNNGFVGGINDARIFFDQDNFRSGDFILEYADADLVTERVDFGTLAFYLRFEDSAGLDNYGIADDVTFIENSGEYQDSFGQLEEVQYALGSGETIDLDFDISGRVDTELIDTRRRSRSTRRTL